MDTFASGAGGLTEQNTNMYGDLPVLKQHKLYLKDFWLEFGVLPYGRRGYSAKSKTETIEGLRKLAEIDLNYQTRYTSREQFEKRKNNRKAFTGFKYCFSCRSKPEIRHHILLLKHGGRNQKNNVIGLCRKCHAEVHDWL